MWRESNGIMAIKCLNGFLNGLDHSFVVCSAIQYNNNDLQSSIRLVIVNPFYSTFFAINYNNNCS